MNVALIWLSVFGSLMIAASGLKVIETSGTLSVAARVVVLALVFLAVCSALEALAWKGPARPMASFMIFVAGAVWAYKSFAPWPASLLTRPWRTTP